MCSPSAPKAPDPKETAGAQTSTNVATALANSQLGNINQIGPNGSVTYSTDPNDSYNFTDPNSGQTHNLPRYTQTTTLSPEQQAIADQGNQTKLNLGTLANTQSSFLNDYMAQPLSLSNDAIDSRVSENYRHRLDPIQDRQRDQLETRLANQGIGIGTEAYDRAMQGLGQQHNDADIQLLQQTRGQSIQEMMTERNQPLNEISALQSGSQVSNPYFGANTNAQQMPTVDYAGLVQQNYQNELGIYNQQMQQQGGILGNALGAAGKIGAAYFTGGTTLPLSDRRAKKDIEKIGTVKGMGLYEYALKEEHGGGPRQIGLMAHEVRKRRPDAVKKDRQGLYHVDYRRALSPDAPKKRVGKK